MPMSPPYRKTAILGITYVLLSAVTFSAKAIFIKVAYRDFGTTPLTLLTLRLLFTMAILGLTWLCVRPKPVGGAQTLDYVKVLLLGVVGFYLSAYLDFSGLQYISASLERIVLFIYPTLVVLLAAVFDKQPIIKRQIAALIITYLGLVAAFVGELSFDQKNLILGTALVFGCACTYAIYVYGSAYSLKTFGSWRFTTFALGGATIAAILNQTFFSLEAVFHQPMGVYTLSFWMALISTVLPTILLVEGIKKIGSANAAIVATAGPICTILLAWAFLGEIVHWSQLIGAALVIGGILILNEK